MGRHKLIPSVSPKKTIEGAVGGIVGAVLCCMLFEYYFGTQREFLMFAVMGLIEVLRHSWEICLPLSLKKEDLM